jgi:hypothetical protein
MLSEDDEIGHVNFQYCLLERHFPGKTGSKGRGRVKSVLEIGQTVETVLGIRDGIQVHFSFHTGGD